MGLVIAVAVNSVLPGLLLKIMVIVANIEGLLSTHCTASAFSPAPEQSSVEAIFNQFGGFAL